MSETTLDNKFDHDSFTLEIMRTGSICNKRSPTFLNKKQNLKFQNLIHWKRLYARKLCNMLLFWQCMQWNHDRACHSWRCHFPIRVIYWWFVSFDISSHTTPNYYTHYYNQYYISYFTYYNESLKVQNRKCKRCIFDSTEVLRYLYYSCSFNWLFNLCFDN